MGIKRRIFIVFFISNGAFRIKKRGVGVKNNYFKNSFFTCIFIRWAGVSKFLRRFIKGVHARFLKYVAVFYTLFYGDYYLFNIYQNATKV